MAKSLGASWTSSAKDASKTLEVDVATSSLKDVSTILVADAAMNLSSGAGCVKSSKLAVGSAMRMC